MKGIQARVPLTVANLERGDFLTKLDAELAEVQHRLIEYRQRHDATDKASITVKIDLVPSKEEPECFAIQTSISSRVPAWPKRSTLGWVGELEGGRAVLTVQPGGSTELDPRQAELPGLGGEGCEPVGEGDGEA